MSPDRIAILGAGSWGTALASVAAWRGCQVTLWGRRSSQIHAIRSNNRNPDYLTEYSLPASIKATSNMAEAVSGSEVILEAVASQAVRDIGSQLSEVYDSQIIVSATKGLEPDSKLRMTEVLAEELPASAADSLCALSGPNFAAEIIEGMPAGTVVGCPDESLASRVQAMLSGPQLRVYTSDDLIGVELGGALKNVYAIAVGMVDSLGLGYNAQSTVITRGIAELVRLGVKMGAHPLTFAGLSGLGDMVLTCTTDMSRNRRAGLALGRGETLQQIQNRGETVEGIRSARAATCLADRFEVEMPIVNKVYEILFEEKDALQAAEELMARSAKTEREVDFVANAASNWLDNSR